MTQDSRNLLHSLRGRPTHYELILTGPAGEKYLILYCAFRTRHSILAAVSRNGQKIAAITGVSTLHFGKRVSDPVTIGDWRITWSGRTERDAIAEGQLPWVGELTAGQLLIAEAERRAAATVEEKNPSRKILMRYHTF